MPSNEEIEPKTNLFLKESNKVITPSYEFSILYKWACLIVEC
jgi:hypothetical protein